MRKLSRPLAIAVLAAALLWVPVGVWASHTFSDVPDSNVFHNDIAWLRAADVTRGCNPPANTEYCPSQSVTREQMAAFMRRLAENRVVDAATVEGFTAAELMAGPTGPAGEVVLMHSHVDLVALVSEVTSQAPDPTFDRTRVYGAAGGTAAYGLALNGPVSMGGVAYGLQSVRYCIADLNSAVIEVVGLTGGGGPPEGLADDGTVRSQAGCYTFTTNVTAGTSYTLLFGVDGAAGTSLTITQVESRWLPASEIG